MFTWKTVRSPGTVKGKKKFPWIIFPVGIVGGKIPRFCKTEFVIYF